MAVTPNSSLETGISSNLLGSTTVSASNVISADSSVASSVSLDEDLDESPIKVKKKDDSHNQVNALLLILYFVNIHSPNVWHLNIEISLLKIKY